MIIRGMPRVGTTFRTTIYGNDYHKGIQAVGVKTLEPVFAWYRSNFAGLNILNQAEPPSIITASTVSYKGMVVLRATR